MLKDHLLAGAITADHRENPRKCTGVTVRGDAKDVIEFLPHISNPGEGRVPGNPGEGERDKFLPAFREGFPKNGEQIPELFREESSISVFSDILGRERSACTPCPFGDETVFLGESAKVCAHFLRRLGGFVIDTCRSVDVGFVLDILDLQTFLAQSSLLPQPCTSPLFHMV